MRRFLTCSDEGHPRAILDRFCCGSSWGVLWIDSPRLSSPDCLQPDLFNREANWLLSIHRCPRIASAGFLSVLIKRFDIDHRLPAHERDFLFHVPTNDLGKSPYRLSDRTTVVIIPSTSTARLSEQSNSSPSVTCTGVKPRPASDSTPTIVTTMQTT